MRLSPRSRPRRTARALAAVLTCLSTLGAGVVLAAPVQAANVVTPGSFTGYGFDQCTAPTQRAMDAWLTGSPYWAAGIYISGASRGCTSQPNLSGTWVRTQLANGWRLLPITLGPQAWCTTRERYLHQVRINPSSATSYAKARAQGRHEAVKTIGAANRLGISKGSTLWYDIEAFPISRTNCRESALSFLSAWTNKMHALGYRSGIYSSAASGIKIIDDARANRPRRYSMPDQLWIADWNRHANVSSSYVRGDGWMPHARVHQYRGGHNETHGGVTINIDNNWLDLGNGTTGGREYRHCGGVRLEFTDYPYRRPGNTGRLVKAAQCLLADRKVYRGKVDGVYDAELGAAVRRYRAARGLRAYPTMTRRTWTALTSSGPSPLVKYGAGGPPVRRLQRALNAATGAHLTIDAVFEGRTMAAVKSYQGRVGLPRTGVVTATTWSRLKHGVR